MVVTTYFHKLVARLLLPCDKVVAWLLQPWHFYMGCQNCIVVFWHISMTQGNLDITVWWMNLRCYSLASLTVCTIEYISGAHGLTFGDITTQLNRGVGTRYRLGM